MSALHMQPSKHDPDTFRALNNLAKNNEHETIAEFQEASIRYDIKTIMQETAAQRGEDPKSFFIVPSYRDFNAEQKSKRVVGVNVGGEFSFYEQKTVHGTSLPSEVRKLEFQDYEEFDAPLPDPLPKHAYIDVPDKPRVRKNNGSLDAPPSNEAATVVTNDKVTKGKCCTIL